MLFVKKNKATLSKDIVVSICDEIKLIHNRNLYKLLDTNDGNERNSKDKEPNNDGVLFSFRQRPTERKDLYNKQVNVEDIINSASKVTFDELIVNYLDNLGLSEKEFYKRAGIGRKIFWNIKNEPLYTPSKETVVSCALGLHLSVSEAEVLLKKVGFAFSDCNLFDVAITYCLNRKIYNIMDVNEILYELGCKTILRVE